MPVTRDLEDVPDRVRTHIEQGIQALMDLGGAVILGRGAAVPLGGYRGAFHVRLDGPPERRARRGAIWEGVDLRTAQAHLEETDTARSRTLRRLFSRHPSDPALYHLIIDSTTMAVDALVEVIASAAQAFWRYDERPLEEVAADDIAKFGTDSGSL